MITDRELDTWLGDAAVVDDVDLPALPDEFLRLLMEDTAPEEPASVVAARQMVADAVAARTSPGSARRRPSRKVLLRAGTALLALAAAWTTAVVVTPPDSSRRPVDATATTAASPTTSVRLVAAEQVTFPLSLDPAPEGLTPTFSKWGGGDAPVVYTADYMSDTGNRILLNLFAEDPRGMSEYGWSFEADPAETVRVHGSVAQVQRGNGFVALLWERPDGQWVRILGEGIFGETPAVVAVAQSVVDRPRPVGLQFGLAPAGWSVTGYEESRSIDLSNDDDPEQMLRLSVYQPGPGTTIDTLIDGHTFAGPVEPVIIQGQPGRLALAKGDAGQPDFWYVVGQLPEGQIWLLLAPQVLTEEQALAIAEQISYRR